MGTIPIFTKKLGGKHPSTAISYKSIGKVYHKLDNIDDALNYLLKALYIQKEILGKGHVKTCETISIIKEVYETNSFISPFEEWLEERIEHK